MSLKDELASLTTEQRNPVSTEIDLMETLQALRLINDEDKKVPNAVETELPVIAKAVELIAKSLRTGGRLIYVGAGTSGRLGVLDASECPPTFGTDPSSIIGIIAGGDSALRSSKEGAEDDAEGAKREMEELKLTKRDVVCGIAASRRTPYVVAAVEKASECGASTIYVTTNPRAEFDLDVDVAICPDVGPEVIMGSTRMKSGTAQKLVLNMLTTAAMISLGKVYENMMVDLQMKSRKLVERGRRILMIATGVDYQKASETLQEANGEVKTALVMIRGNITAPDARKKLKAAGGFVRKVAGL